MRWKIQGLFSVFWITSMRKSKSRLYAEHRRERGQDKMRLVLKSPDTWNERRATGVFKLLDVGDVCPGVVSREQVMSISTVVLFCTAAWTLGYKQRGADNKVPLSDSAFALDVDLGRLGSRCLYRTQCTWGQFYAFRATTSLKFTSPLCEELVV